ncbi:MAG: glycosyltransferase family 2 protein [Chthoniobacteraceae bacterium]
MAKCSVIIPVFGKAALTRQCLDAVSQTSGNNYEVIVVNDASKDDTSAMLEAYGSAVTVVTHASNKGFATSCNDGAAAAKGDYFVFLNNDTIPKKGWLEALAAYADEHPRAGAVGAKLLFPNDTIEHAGMAIRNDGHPIHIYAGFAADHPAVNKSRRYQILTGACLLIRRDAFEEVKGFDTAFLNSHEDVDLCLRLGSAGHEVHYCHTSEVYHLETSTRELNSPSEERNTRLYLSRWKDARADDFYYYVEDGLIKPGYSLQYPIRITISPELATQGVWTEAHAADRMLHDRSRQVHELLLEKKNFEQQIKELESRCQQASGNGAAPMATAGRDEVVDALNARIEEMRGMLMQAHGQLLLRDEMQMETDQVVAAEKIKRLSVYLNQLDAAVERLYQSRRWELANPVAALRRMFSGAKSKLPGYGKIDQVLGAYRAWLDKNPSLREGRKDE